MGVIADRIKKLSASIARKKEKIKADKAKIVKLRSKCGHLSRLAVGNDILEGGYIEVVYECAECGAPLGQERGGLMCIKDQEEMDGVPHGSDQEADAERIRRQKELGQDGYHSVGVFRCPKCRKLKTISYYDR